MAVIGKAILLLFDMVDTIFYDLGDEHTKSTGGWSLVSSSTQGSLTKNSNNMFLRSNATTNNAAAQTANGFDFSEYTTLHFIVTATGSAQSRVGISDTHGAYANANLVKYQSFTNKGSSPVQVDVDISGLAAGAYYYPTIRTQATSNGLTLHKCWVD